jgi:hypothetical protein
MPLALLSALAGWAAASIVALACVAHALVRLYAGEAALPALFKLLRHGKGESEREREEAISCSETMFQSRERAR